MIKDFFFASALLAPAFAYAATPSADLSVKVVPAQSSCLADSICPAGVTWSLVFDEEMSKGYLSSLFGPISRADEGCNCYSDGVHGFSFPGDGTLTMNGWAAESLPASGGKHGGITISSTQNYAAPGYYEIKASIGSDWNGMFTLGNYVCPAAVPGEMDFIENPAANGHLASYYHNGTSGCEYDHVVANEGTDFQNVHVYGFDVSTSRGLTAYVDGVAMGNMPSSWLSIGLCTNASVCGTKIWLQAGGPGGDAVPMKVYWIRYYTGVPQ